MLQKMLMVFTNSTWNCTGTSQRLMVVAMGQNFHPSLQVTQIFYRAASTPFPNDRKSRSFTIWLTTKNPTRWAGANTSWSITIDPITRFTLLMFKKRACWILGRILLYQVWRTGAK